MRRLNPLFLTLLLAFPLLFVTSLSAASHAGRPAISRKAPSKAAAKKASKSAAKKPSKPPRIKRSAAAKRAFQKSSPCPATGKTTGPCKGYVIDHVKPLACGGADAPSNMQWQTTAAAKLKDKTERIGCGK